MATRFGGSKSRQFALKKLYWLVGLLCSVIIVLLSVVVISFGEMKRQGEDEKSDPFTPVTSRQSALILIARQRIEADSQLSHTMLSTKEVSSGHFPHGALSEQDRASLTGLYTTRVIDAGSYLTREDFTDREPLPFSIPQGFRLVSFKLEEAALGDPLIKPASRVDILWFRKDKSGNDKLSTIIHFTKVISLDGRRDSEENLERKGVGRKSSGAMVTVLVSEKDSKLLEFAKHRGSLSLTLVGSSDADPRVEDPAPVDESDFEDGPKVEEPTGTVQYVDPKTGALITRKLRKGEVWNSSL